MAAEGSAALGPELHHGAGTSSTAREAYASLRKHDVSAREARAGGGAAPRSRESRREVEKEWGLEELQDALRHLAPTSACFHCCNSPVHGGKEIEFWKQPQWEGGPQRGTIGGVQHCKSPHACAYCTPRLARERARLLERVGRFWIDGVGVFEPGRFGCKCEPSPAHGEGSILLLTLTSRHTKDDALSLLLDGHAKAWKRVQQSHAWRTLRKDGVEVVRGSEVRRGGYAGWGPHYHLYVFLPRAFTPEEIEALAAMIRPEWERAIRDVMGDAYVPNAHGVDLRVAADMGYVAKLGLELTSSATKEKKRGGHLGPWDIARRAAEGNRGYQELWREYGAATARHQALNWPKADASRVKLLRELAEEELEQEAETQQQPRSLVATIPVTWWTTIAKLGALAQFRGEVLEVVESGGGELEIVALVVDTLERGPPKPWYEDEHFFVRAEASAVLRRLMQSDAFPPASGDGSSGVGIRTQDGAAA